MNAPNPKFVPPAHWRAANTSSGAEASTVAQVAKPDLKPLPRSITDSLADVRTHSTTRLQQPVTSTAFTLVTSDALLTKSISVGPSGKIMKSGAIKLYAGTAARVSATGQPVEVLARLKETLESLTSKQAIICAPPPAGRAECPITTKYNPAPAEGAITRTKENFAPVQGPALLGLDFDTAEFPEDLLEQLKQAGGISNALKLVYPAFRDAAVLTRPSASAAVKLKGSQRADLSAGQHRYYIVSDGLRITEAVQILADRLMLAGFIWGKITEHGKVLPRTLIDVDASRDSSRLWYEAHPILTDDRLELDLTARPAEIRGTQVLDLSGLVALNEAERQELDSVKADLIARMEPKATATRKTYEAKRIREMVAKGTSEEAARRQVTHAIDKQELCGDFEIQFDDGTCATVREIRAEPQAYHGKTGPDPMEPEYNGGHNLAKLYTDGQQPHIYSHAHGGIKYLLVADVDDHLQDIPENPSPADERSPIELDRSAVGSDAPTATASAPATPSRFKFETLDDIDLALQEDPLDPLIEGVLNQGDFSCIYGGSNVGKSFVALDMAYAIAQGREWAGQKTKKKGVLYVAAEGGKGILPRIKALQKVHGRVASKNFILLRHQINLFASDADVKDLIRGAKAHGLNEIGLVVFDTLSRSMDGGEENSVRDMNTVVGHVKLLREEIDAHVMLIHHSGKNEARGLRGSSSLRAALDTEIELQKSSGDGPTGGTLTVTKQRDMDGNFGRDFTLQTVKLTVGGNRETSTCIARTSSVKVSRRDKPTPKQKQLLDVMLTLGADLEAVETEDVALALDPSIENADLETKKKKVEAVRGSLRRCAAKNFVRVDADGLWRIRTTCPAPDAATWFEDEENPPVTGSSKADMTEEAEHA